nr:SAM-dependent methyltransferase [Streptomyces sp. SID3343]
MRYGIDAGTASDARLWDWLLGGFANYAADRRAGERLLELAPSAAVIARHNSDFGARAARVLVAGHGITQLLDLGSGLPNPTADVNAIARAIDPSVRLLLVDRDPLAYAHTRSLHDDDHTRALHADLVDIDSILDHPLIVPGAPTGVLLTAALHGLPDDTAVTRLLQRLRERLVPGSLLVVSHLVADDVHHRTAVTDHMNTSTAGQWGRIRTRAELDHLLATFEPLDPGLVDVSHWRPDPDRGVLQTTREWAMYGGVAHLHHPCAH